MGYLESDRKAGKGISRSRLIFPDRNPEPFEIPTPDDAIRSYGTPPASAELRGARLSQGFSVDDASEHYRIPAEHIDAMERADLSGLPGRAYLDGFIRSYAKQVDAEGIFGHDPDWYVAELKKEYQRGPYFRPQAQYLDQQEQPRDRYQALALRAAFAIICIGLVVSVVYGAWYAYQAVQHIAVIDAPGGGGATVAGSAQAARGWVARHI